jgi:K+/H+ antiporter YhaU regulatory subunit KhtT
LLRLAYGVAKIYEKGNQQILTINVKEKPDVVYAKTIAAIEERGITKITKRDDKKMVLTVERNELPGYVKVAPLAGEETSVLTIALEKGKDPKAQREEMVQSVMGACSKLGLECTEEKK